MGGTQDAGYTITTDTSRMDVALIHGWLSGSSYWARGRSLETVRTCIEHSLCFGVFSAAGEQVGFARVITDRATFAWLGDVFILEAHRGRGLSKRLVEAVIAHPDLAGVRRIVLRTRDAHELYRHYGGFTALAQPEDWMERVRAV